MTKSLSITYQKKDRQESRAELMKVESHRSIGPSMQKQIKMVKKPQKCKFLMSLMSSFLVTKTSVTELDGKSMTKTRHPIAKTIIRGEKHQCKMNPYHSPGGLKRHVRE